MHARHLYSIRVREHEAGRERDRVLDELLAQGIGCGVHFSALHLHRHYRETLGHREGDFPRAEGIGARTLSLPLSGSLGQEEVRDVVEALVRAVRPVAARTA